MHIFAGSRNRLKQGWATVLVSGQHVGRRSPFLAGLLDGSSSICSTTIIVRVRAGERGAGGAKYRGPSCFEGPVEGPHSYLKFFFRDTREDMLEKLPLPYVRTYVQCAK